MLVNWPDTSPPPAGYGDFVWPLGPTNPTTRASWRRLPANQQCKPVSHMECESTSRGRSQWHSWRERGAARSSQRLMCPKPYFLFSAVNLARTCTSPHQPNRFYLKGTVKTHPWEEVSQACIAEDTPEGQKEKRRKTNCDPFICDSK